MDSLPHITECEWAVISTLWGESPLTAAEIVKQVQAERNLPPTTVKTLLRRLIAKKAVGFTVDDDNAKLYHYYPLVAELDCVLRQSEHFLSLYFKDNIVKLFSTYVNHTDLSDAEIESVRELLEKRNAGPNG